MPEAGGSANISGNEYEQWVFVRFMVLALITDSEIISITPQKTREFPQISQEEIETIAIDDLVIEYDTGITHYTIKQHSPSARWTVSELKSAGVLSSIKEQHEKTPDRNLRLISQSDSQVMREFSRLEGITSREAIEDTFSKVLLKEWDALKSEFKFSDSELLTLVKSLELEQLSLKEIKKSIINILEPRFNAAHLIGGTLFEYAFSRAKWKKRTTKEDILNFLSDKGFNEKSELSLLNVNQALLKSSTNLQASKSPFEFKHIHRNETDQIMSWVEQSRDWTDSNVSKILTVTGKAGMGKTTVLQDVLSLLQKNDIPVIGVKSDIVKFNNSHELQSQLDLPDTLERILSLLSDKSPKSILLIDQIDALSLSLSADRSQLDKYKELIAYALRLPNILIILSCRSYDLNNDLDLNQYRQNKQVEVGMLLEKDVWEVLSGSGYSPELLPQETIDLLKTPLHLAIYVMLLNSKFENDEDVITLNDLYRKLWQKIILGKTNSQKLQLLVESISMKMYREQSIVTGDAILESEYLKELTLLKSDGILLESKNGISYFHQTFFDYSLARGFIEKGESISDDLKTSVQGLYQRPRVKAILEYLYESSPISFIKECNSILFNDEFRVHIKYLVLNILGFREIIDKNLEALGQKILDDKELRIPFLKSIVNRGWIEFLASDHVKLEISDNSTRSSISQICHFNGKSSTNEVIQLLKKYQFELDKEEIARCLGNCVDTDNVDFIELVESYKKEIISWNHYFYRIVSSAMDQEQYEFVSNALYQYHDDLKLYEVKEEGEYFNHLYKEMIEKLWKVDKNQAYRVSIKYLQDILESSTSEYQGHAGYIESDAFRDFSGNENVQNIRNHHLLYEWILTFLCERIEKEEIDFVEKELDNLLNSKFLLHRYLAFELILKNIEMYAIRTFELLTNKELIKKFEYGSAFLQFLTGNLITALYPHVDKDKQEAIYWECMHVDDWFVGEFWGKKERNYSLFISRYRLMSRIPERFILIDPEKKKQFLEFERRFGKISWEKPKGIQTFLSSGSIPLPEKAYDSLSFDELESSFHKVYGKRNSRGRGDASVFGHAEAFKKIANNDPDKYFPFVVKLINETPENNLDSVYAINGALGLLENHISADGISLMHEMIDKKEYFDHYSHEMVTMIKIFISQQLLDDTMFQFLSDKLISCSIQLETAYTGHYVDALFECKSIKKYRSEIIPIVEKVSSGINLKMKLILIGQLAHLNVIDKVSSHRIFVKLIYDVKSDEIYKYARSSIQYMLNVEAKPIMPFLKNAIDKIEDEVTVKWYGQLIASLTINEVESSKELLLLAEKQSNSFVSGILSFSINVIEEELSDPDIQKRAWVFIEKYITIENQDLYNNYQVLIRHISKSKFKEYIKFLKIYINGAVRNVNHRQGSFYDKLYEMASIHPNSCIELCDSEIKSTFFLNQHLTYYGGEKTVFDVLVKAYNSLSSILHESERKKALQLMDDSLRVISKNPNYNLQKTFETFSQNEKA